MQACGALLVLALAAVASAHRPTLGAQPFMQAVLDLGAPQETVFVSTRSGQPSLTAFVRELDADGSQQTVLFDSGLQSWMDQQLGVIDALQSLFAPRPPCGGRQSIFETQDPSFAYMASSRFGSLLTTFTEEADRKEVWSDSELETQGKWEPVEEGEEAWATAAALASSDSLDRIRHFPDWLAAEEVQGEPEDLEEVDDEALPRTLFAPGQPGDKAARPRGPHEPNMHKHHAHMASCADMLTFATLLFGCVVVWGCLLRTFIRCRRMVRKNEAALLKAGKRAAVVEHNPLLTPLVREESIDVPQVAVASYEVPSGSYYVPQGSQYVQVAYQPLRSE